jgi:sodium/potassium-transporting ATPase subunit alpha
MSATNEAGGYADGRDMTIQFAPAVKPAPIEASHVDEIARSRRQSVVSIPHVLSEEEKDRREVEKNLESKHAKIDEHLMLPHEVGDQYKTRIDTETPSASQGLTVQQADRLLAKYGRNVLTPPKKRHPFMAFLDCLRSLFNLLLILAGVLEYILLAIDFKGNFQNVSFNGW